MILKRYPREQEMIEYSDSLDGIRPVMLEGFFVGWRTPHSPERHLEILENSDHVLLAVDTEKNRVVGFITALSDGIQSAFIPMLEVLPEYRGRGIGTELMRMMLERVDHIRAVDLTCDRHLQPFYERFGMLKSVGMVVRKYLKDQADQKQGDRE
jgi:ribosomal protein S18 acetylase RimI-like enzyme